ncbi:protein FAM3C isoform X1 [Hippoglossus hippoglossus]|uniref:protein FAM3C isoform X1 n=1 Tax=Hippoglossus hippoglossus TaxID=8267 RepID=UPI00148C595F|nr:protein FAM3C isoform X1 [Hippoglossus hippoglossus]
MKFKGVLNIVVGMVVLLIIWGIASFNAGDRSAEVFVYDDDYQKKLNVDEGFDSSKVKCSISERCQPGHFAFRIRSGAANTVGPKICFDGKTIMSEARNNVGGGLDIVVVNGKTGVVENARILNGSPQETLSFLKDIKPGMIVLVASYDNANGMTDEIRNLFSEMGSSKAKSLKFRDNWVFAVRTGLENTLHFEKINVNDEKNNLYEGWPETAEVEGCFSSIVGQANLSDV